MNESLKHTLAGIFSGLIGTFTSIMTLQVPMALLNPQQSKTWLWITVGCNLAAIILRTWVGVITQGAATANQIGQIAQTTMNSGVPCPNAAIPPTAPHSLPPSITGAMYKAGASYIDTNPPPTKTL